MILPIQHFGPAVAHGPPAVDVLQLLSTRSIALKSVALLTQSSITSNLATKPEMLTLDARVYLVHDFKLQASSVHKRSLTNIP